MIVEKKTEIDWYDVSWNPVTGCLHGCNYCLNRVIANSCKGYSEDYYEDNPFFQLIEYDGELIVEIEDMMMRRNELGHIVPSSYPFGFIPTLHRHMLDLPQWSKWPLNILVCDRGDLFGDWVPDAWIEQVFAACEAAPQHRYLFLTKNPQRYCELAEAGILRANPNWWYGTTITSPDQPFFFWDKANNFVSIEPLLKPFDAASGSENPFDEVGWVIVGAMTGSGRLEHQPKREWVETIVNKADEAGASVFMKDSLRDLMGDDFQQELPWEA